MRSQLQTLYDRSNFTCWDLFYDCFLLFLLGTMQTKHSNSSFTQGGGLNNSPCLKPYHTGLQIENQHQSANTVVHICVLTHLFTQAETQHGPKKKKQPYVLAHMF